MGRLSKLKTDVHFGISGSLLSRFRKKIRTLITQLVEGLFDSIAEIKEEEGYEKEELDNACCPTGDRPLNSIAKIKEEEGYENEELDNACGPTGDGLLVASPRSRKKKAMRTKSSTTPAEQMAASWQHRQDQGRRRL
ncbi:hypothetical protein HII31_04025 [Pseudocercospora fuligena]|uniref:Uncharacterized protein n=1 Tax=Pseudocercospora fuligena TaxID=685502 RepID=A0A8H6VNC8_9PEZI|nr:hypothetical protein HII31_04025 [Pseudocercospora fuligena]